MMYLARHIDNFRGWLRDARTIYRFEYAADLHHASNPMEFDFHMFRADVEAFVRDMQSGDSQVCYRYSAGSRPATLYGSAYACMTLSLLGRLEDSDQARRKEWVTYFDSFQHPDDGLFWDPEVINDIYPDSDWWGARHLALHLASAYTDLRGRPAHPFRFLVPYYDSDLIRKWLDAQEWRSAAIGHWDVDNRIMNIGCLLQYQRDNWADAAAGDAVDFLKRYLRARINPATGMWGGFDEHDPHERSRMVQFAYHLFCLYFHDGDFDFDHEKILRIVLHTQNRLGGWGVRLNSSACEDIDSIDILIRLAPHVPTLRPEIDAALSRTFLWVLHNKVADGGFVFRLFEPFIYGHEATSSARNEGGMLPTWFRTLSLGYLTKYLSIPNGFIITRCPGYEY